MNFNDIKSLPDVPALLNHDGFKQHYIALYNDTHKSTHGAAHWARETNFVKRMCMDSEDIRKATPLSMAMALLNLASSGLSIDPIDKALAYIFPRGGSNKVVFDPSPYGELALRIRNGVVTSVKGPVLVYDGDIVKGKNGDVDIEQLYKSEKIIGVWVRVYRPDRTHEDKYFTMAQILTYRDKSRSQNSTGWTGGVAVDGQKQPTRGMLEAKALKHTMDTYPLYNLNAEAAFANTYAALTTGDDKTDVEALTEGRETYENYEEGHDDPPPPPPAAEQSVRAAEPEKKEPVKSTAPEWNF